MTIYDKGHLLIDSKEDRATVAEILYKNGYTVSPVRFKKNGKTFTYLVGYEMRDSDIKEEDVAGES